MRCGVVGATATWRFRRNLSLARFLFGEACEIFQLNLEMLYAVDRKPMVRFAVPGRCRGAGCGVFQRGSVRSAGVECRRLYGATDRELSRHDVERVFDKQWVL